MTLHLRFIFKSFCIFIVFAALLASEQAYSKPRSTAGTKFDDDDKYVACVIGRSIVKVHQGLNSDKAIKFSENSCGKVPHGLVSGDDAGEGYSDFIYHTVEEYATANGRQ